MKNQTNVKGGRVLPSAFPTLHDGPAAFIFTRMITFSEEADCWAARTAGDDPFLVESAKAEGPDFFVLTLTAKRPYVLSLCFAGFEPNEP